MCQYKHLTLIEREKILFFQAQHYLIKAIANELGRHKSTISRELKRNREGHFYQPATAQQQYQKRRLAC